MGAQKQVLERDRLQIAEAAVHAGHIGVQHGAFLGGHGGQDRSRAVPETVQSDGSVAPEGGATDEIGEFACCAAALAIHLEEALLPMQVTESPGEIRTGAAAERRHALGVARHGHTC